MITRRLVVSVLLAATLFSAAPAIAGMPDPGNLVAYRGQNGQQFTFTVTGYALGYVWGNRVYTDDSSLASAAVHDGLLGIGETGDVTVEILPGQDSYDNSMRNGIATMDFGPSPGAFRFVH